MILWVGTQIRMNYRRNENTKSNRRKINEDTYLNFK
jgi:hypothetical protein